MKRKAMGVVEWVAYWSGIDALFYWLNRGVCRAICFHNVLPDELLSPADRGGICFSASEFRQVVRALRPYRDVIDLTFDDGYANQYEIAAKILEEEGMVGTLFVAGNLVGSHGFEHSLVIDQILQWKIDVPMEKAEALFGRSFASREQMWSECLLPMFAADGATKGRQMLAKLSACWSPTEALYGRDPEYLRLRFDGVTAEQIADLRRRGWRVGHHTNSHFPVSCLSDEAAREELTPADGEMLKTVFAYPYGNPDFVGERDEAIVRELGYPCAYSCGFDPDPRHGQYFLPRMMPPIGRCRFHFEVSGVRHFLRYRKSM